MLDRQANLLDQLLDVAEARRQGGEASGLDVAGFRARRAALDTRAIGVRAQRRAARLTLARLIGRPSGDTEFDLDSAGDPQPLAAEEQYLLTALAARPEVQAQRFEVTALGEQVTLAGFAPFDGLGAGVASETEGETSVGPAVSVPIPIFDFGTTGKERARADVLAARHRLTGVSRLVIEEVRQARAAALAADESLGAITDTLLPLQRNRIEQTRAAYRAGFADVTDVLAAEQDLLDAEAELIDARFRREAADADLVARPAAWPTLLPTPSPHLIHPTRPTPRPSPQGATHEPSPHDHLHRRRRSDAVPPCRLRGGRRRDAGLHAPRRGVHDDGHDGHDGHDDHEDHEADEKDHADHEEHGPGEHGAAAPTRLNPIPAGSPRTAIARSN